MTEEQMKLAEEYWEYVTKQTYKWAWKHDSMWCINELMSAAGLVLTICAKNYAPRADVKFTSYLTLSLFRRLNYERAITGWYKPMGTNGKNWESPFYDVGKDISDASDWFGYDDDFDKMNFDYILTKVNRDSDRELLVDMFVEGLSMEDVAKKRNCTRENIRQLKVKVFGRLKKILLRERNA